ncbi:MAG TPA: sigma-E processing peptidase SpoIIGA [Symbiobacteriaceae bacterium]|nr:sigma-E processing peptidase SpoIIGA [Symbiobacteriaceae bacterium]
MVRVVSVDIFFLANFGMDLVWLGLTARLAGLRAGRWRLAAAAAAGGLLAVWALFPTGLWLRSPLGSALGTLGLLALAFAPCPLMQAGRALGCFLLSGAAIAGTVMLVELRRPGAGLVMPPTFAGGLVLAGLALAGAGGRYLWTEAKRRRQLSHGLWTVQVELGGQAVTLQAFVDTGNHLKDPLAGTPVMVAELAAIRPLLPADVCRSVALGWEGLERLPGAWAARCRLVPYRAVGRPEGMLLALAPDRLAVMPPGGGPWHAVQGLVGLSTAPLDPGGAYRALLPLQLTPGEE